MRKTLAILVCASFSLPSCASVLQSNDLGIDSKSLPSALQRLHSRAQSGDKSAQFELGEYFADGTLLAKDCKTARRLWRLAAMETGGTLWVYSPPVGNGTNGRTIPINRGPKVSGLVSAKEALEHSPECPPA